MIAITKGPVHTHRSSGPEVHGFSASQGFDVKIDVIMTSNLDYDEKKTRAFDPFDVDMGQSKSNTLARYATIT